VLVDKFNTALRSVCDVSSNPYLIHLAGALRIVESTSAGEMALATYIRRLDALISQPYFALDSIHSGEFSQILGEAHFYCMCLERGVCGVKPKSR
jgi:hypothetical protein